MRKVNWANPITRNMFFCVAGSSLQNLVNKHGAQFSQLVSESAVEYYSLNEQEVNRFTSVGNWYSTTAEYGNVLNSNIRNANTQFVYFKPFIPSDHKSQPGELIGFNPSDAGYLSWNSVNPGLRYGGHYGSSWYSGGASSVFPANKWIAVGFRWDGDKISLWIDGVKDGEIDTQNSPSPDLTYNTKLAGGEYGAYFAGDIAVACQWDRALSDSEMQRLGNDPFQVLEQHPIIGAHQLPEHVDYGVVKVIPWDRQPPPSVRASAPNLIGAYTFTDGALNDRVTGQLATNDGCSIVHSVHPWAKTAFNISGYAVNDSIDLPNTPALRYDGATELTIMVLARTPAAAVGDFHNLFAVRSGATLPVVFYQTRGQNNNRAELVINGGTAAFGSDNFYAADNFHWYCVRWNGTNAYFYRDAVSWGSGAVSGTIPASSIVPALGNTSDNATDRGLNGDVAAAFFFDADIGELRLFSYIHNPGLLFERKEIMVPMNEDLPDLVTFELPWTEQPK